MIRIMLDAPALPPPAIVSPAPREVSFGLVAGRAPLGTRKIIVHVGRYVAAEEPLQGRSFSLHVRLTGGPTEIKVTAVDGRNRRSSRVVEQVFGLPRASDPRQRAPRLDAALGRSLRTLARRHGGTSGIYVQDLRTGRGAAWNAKARFPAGSTLKLAIAVTVLRSLEHKPESFTQVARLLAHMLVNSDNDAANALEVWLAGSTSAGSDRVDETMRALGLGDSLMYGGYTVRTLSTRIPVRVDDRPAFGAGKYTTAWDLASLWGTLWLASGGKGPLRAAQPGLTPADARHLLWLTAHVRDQPKLDTVVGRERGVRVLHKAGWISTARHDTGLVFWSGGVFVASVMTWQASGVSLSSDRLAGRIAAVTLARLRRREG